MEIRKYLGSASVDRLVIENDEVIDKSSNNYRYLVVVSSAGRSEYSESRRNATSYSIPIANALSNLRSLHLPLSPMCNQPLDQGNRHLLAFLNGLIAASCRNMEEHSIAILPLPISMGQGGIVDELA